MHKFLSSAKSKRLSLSVFVVEGLVMYNSVIRDFNEEVISYFATAQCCKIEIFYK